MRVLLFFLLIQLFNTSSHAQQMVAREVPFYYQLSSNEIWDFYQDKEGYIWVGTTNGLVRYDGYNLQNFRAGYKTASLLTDNSIVCMADNDTHLWIGTRKGLNMYDKSTCGITPVPDEILRKKEIDGIYIDKKNNPWVASEGNVYQCNNEGEVIKEYKLSSSGINQIYGDKEGNIWVLVWRDGLFKYDSSTDAFINYPRIGEQNAPFTMYQDKVGNYWIGTWGEGLWQFYPDAGEEAHYKRHHVISSRNGESDPIFYSLTQDDDCGYLWALSYNELYALQIQEDGTLKNVDISNLLDTHMMFTRIFKDRAGSLWLSSYDMAYTVFFDNSEISNYKLPQIKEQLGWDANIMNLCLDNGGVMWMMQDRYGLYLYDISQDKLVSNAAGNYPFEFKSNVISKTNPENGIWVGSALTSHVVKLVRENMTVRVKEDINLACYADNPGQTKQLMEDLRGNLWVLTSNGIFFRPKEQNHLIISNAELPHMTVLAMDVDGKLWGIGTDCNIYNLRGSKDGIYCEAYSRIEGLDEKEIIKNSTIDRDGCMWLISSFGKAYRSNKDKGAFESILTDGELEDSSVLDLLAGSEHVWIATNKKVIQYDIGQQSFYSYNTSDGNISVNVLRYKAVTLDDKGGLFAGGHGGFMHIRSSKTRKTRADDIHLTVTDVKTDNTGILFNEENNNTVQKVYLNPQDKNLELFFSTLRYKLTPNEKIAYKLEGVDTDWIPLEYPKNTAFYNRLGKGTYKLWLKTEYEPGKWTDEEMVLTIEKLPAVYETWYAMLFYMAIVVLLLYLLVRLLIRRMELKNRIRFKEELNRAKLDYFTNVSHDILTPLTIISCSVDNLSSKKSVLDKESAVLKSNVDKLKRLIQQMLDFRKMDSGRMKLSVNYGNINGFISSICQTGFVPFAAGKNINLQTDFMSGAFYGYLDFDKLDKILYNLLSNAIKYTPENRNIMVIVRQILKEEHNFLELIVKDEGIGIHANDIERIFTRFYNQRKQKGIESNGIGLSFVKELVELQHGSITVESMLDEGTVFTVHLPVDKECYTAEEIAENNVSEKPKDISEEVDAIAADAEKTVILLIDDNTELLYVLNEMFKERYSVVTATSGKHAWQKLNNHDVDVIICDVMMGEENGWDFCKRVKSDLHFNHVPIIMLTAKNGVDDRVAGYEAGADGYVAKPFEKKLLVARVDNLIKSYKNRRSAFCKEESVNLDKIDYQSADRKFLQTVIDCIMQHMEESEFDLELLSSSLNMSKSTLHRKIKSMSGLTPLDFIRNVKMKQACTMLQQGNITISEVAYALGFSNPKYFSKCFKEEFGVTPSEYQQKYSS